jgi:hypothetical protein
MQVTLPRSLQFEIAFICTGERSIDAVPGVFLQASDPGLTVKTTLGGSAGQWGFSPRSHADGYLFAATFETTGPNWFVEAGTDPS